MPKTSYYGNHKINKGVRLMRMVMCSKLKKELEGLDRPSYPGELGKKYLIIFQKKHGLYG